MLKEFKQFAMRGNVLDLAVGVIIGAAFGRIVSSFVNDLLMPPIGLLVGNVDFGELFVALNGEAYSSLAEAQAAGAPTLNYGVFINSLIDFVIVAFVIFLLIRTMNRMQKPADPTTQDCPHCLLAIPIKATRCPHCTSQLQAG